MNPRRYLLISSADSVANSMVSAALKAEDELETARDPAEAVQLMRQAPPDAVLWAMDPADEESVVACRTLRRQSQAPIVMLVSPNAKEQVLRGYRLGADAHIAIPCDRREFSARVSAVLRRAA
jgi:DNA-binding response OmpR family regulator